MSDRKDEKPAPDTNRPTGEWLGINSMGVRQPDPITKHPGVRQPSPGTSVGPRQPTPAAPPPPKR